MKTKALYLLASIVLLSLVSCTNEVQELANEQSQALKQIVMTTQDFQPEADSRTVYQIADGAVKCTWATNDTVGVFPNEGAQAYFPMASGAGTKNATFDGKGWALKDGYTYGAYYPCIGQFYLDRHAVPVSYTGQKQVGNGSMAHLGDYDYMVATPTAPEFGSAQFMFKHLSALVQLKVTIPEPATFTSVKLVTDTKAFAVEGKVDVMADAPVITPTAPATEVVLNLQNVVTTKENEVVTFYLMLPPADLSGKTLKAVLVSDKGNVEVDLESKNFKAGTAYALSGEMESTDAGYKDGVVTILEAGSMKQLLGDNLLNITSLKVIGPINGDDVTCLRQMLGGSEFSNAEKGNLTSLDLSEATIVKGGKRYCYIYNSSYYTSNDVIGGYMFYKCANLLDIVLPVGVTSIGNSAFEGCSSLTFIDVTAGVTSIGSSAFLGCSSLASIGIPATVTSIGSAAFQDCASLKSVHITDLSAWCKITFCPLTLSNPLFYAKKLYLNNEELTELVIPEGITEIKNKAFYGCSSLISIKLPASVTSIGSDAFRNCSSLISIDIPNSVSSIGEQAFYFCSSLTSIKLPASVTSIGSDAFSGCTSLASVTMGAGITSIDDYAFYGCSSLKSVYITDLSAWCKITFGDSSSNPLYNKSKLYLNNEELTELVIPADIKQIKDYAFYGCNSITKVTMCEGVTSIRIMSFRDCSSLTQVSCQGTTPPTINPSSANSSFNGASEKKTLYVPKGYSSAYQSSSWADFFGTIKEMD